MTTLMQREHSFLQERDASSLYCTCFRRARRPRAPLYRSILIIIVVILLLILCAFKRPKVS